MPSRLLAYTITCMWPIICTFHQLALRDLVWCQLPIWVDLRWCQWWAHLHQEWCQLDLVSPALQECDFWSYSSFECYSVRLVGHLEYTFSTSFSCFTAVCDCKWWYGIFLLGNCNMSYLLACVLAGVCVTSGYGLNVKKRLARFILGWDTFNVCCCGFSLCVHVGLLASWWGMASFRQGVKLASLATSDYSSSQSYLLQG